MTAVNRIMVASVGGSEEPVIKSILHWKPQKVIFLVSKDTRAKAKEIEYAVQLQGYPEFVGRSECYDLDDPQHLPTVSHQVQRLFLERVASYQSDGWETIVDFTGGTKVMSAALVLAAFGSGKCDLSYVGGTYREKGGVGNVVSGSETIVQSFDPWETSGLRALGEAEALLRNQAYSAAVSRLRRALPLLSDRSEKERVKAFETLADALSKWDLFEFENASKKILELQPKKPHLEVTLGIRRAGNIIRRLDDLRQHCDDLAGRSEDGGVRLNRSLILDLLANAQRRYDEGRFDDATARLYRVIEAIAQLHLQERGYETKAIPVEQLPPLMKAKHSSGLDVVRLGLQDAWELLAELDDPAAAAFKRDLGDPRKSPLTARNGSILAHGFSPVSENVTKQLLKHAKSLLGVETIDPIFLWS